MSFDGLLNVMRREAAVAVASREFRGTLVVTAYNPKTYAVKGIIVPHEIESGWVQITGDHIGKGFGNLAGPKVGSADALDGDQFAIEFDRGDPNTLVATHRIFSDQDKPPVVQSGEMLLQHESGNKVFFAADKSVTVVGQSGSQTKHHVDGRISMKPATGKNAYYGGDPDQGGNFDLVKTVNGTAQNVMAKIG